jgi:hypothetical protein
MAITISGDTPNFSAATITTGTVTTLTAPTSTITTLNAPSGVLATQNGMTGIAKAYIFFTNNGSTLTTYQSFNVSSITRVTTGTIDINLTTAMSSNAYPCFYSTNAGGSTTLGTAPTFNDRIGCATPTSTTQFRVISGQQSSSSTYDNFWNSAGVLGT